MSIAFRYAARSDTGRVRSKNDDSAYTGRYLAVVADGMGGHVGGNVASASTVLDLTPLDHRGYAGSAGTYLADEIQTANIILNQLVELNPLLAGMGTTCTALLLDGDHVEIAHIGDSRAYRLREGVLEQMTTDHTFVQRLVEEGRIRPEEAESHPHKNVVMRVLGDTDASPELELKQADARLGDRWLLCSDGLSGVVSEQMIHDALASGDDLDEICRGLVQATLDRGAPDNVTVAVVEIVEDPDGATPRTNRLDAVEEAPVQAPAPQTATTKALPATDEPTASADAAPWVATTEDGEPEGAGAEAIHADARTQDAADAADLPEDGLEDEAEDPETPLPQHRVAPWRRRLPRSQGQKIRHTIRQGAWRGDSFSDGVLNAMTQRSGIDLEDARDQELSSAAVLRNELAERPHLIVGAASSATHTGAIPTVTDSTVQRRATLAQASAAEPEEEDEDLPVGLVQENPQAGRKRRWGVTLFTWAFLAVMVVAAIWAGLAWINSRYYVGESEGYVTIYRGVDQSLGPIHLDSLEQGTDLKVESLPEYDQTRVDRGIAAASREEADRIVEDLTKESTADGAATASPSPTASIEPSPPQGTVSTESGEASPTSSGGGKR